MKQAIAAFLLCLSLVLGGVGPGRPIPCRRTPAKSLSPPSPAREIPPPPRALWPPRAASMLKPFSGT